MLQSCDHRFSIHGLAVQIDCRVPALNWPIQHALGEFSTTDWPEGFAPLPGSVELYEETTVLRHLSPQAVPIAQGANSLEIYEHGSRFWLVDDRWGLCEVNLVSGEWRSWVLARPAIDLPALVDHAILWPAAQMLRGKGLWMIPAVSICRDGFGVLLLCPFSLEPELTLLAEAGWKVIGQRWTALREEDDRISMLRLPGRLERAAMPRLKGTGTPDEAARWVDLTAELPGCRGFHSFCDAVVVMAAGRRPQPVLQQVSRHAAAHALRAAWPTIELTDARRPTSLATRLSGGVPVFSAALSRDPAQLALQLETVRHTGSPAPVGKIVPTVPAARARRAVSA